MENGVPGMLRNVTQFYLSKCNLFMSRSFLYVGKKNGPAGIFPRGAKDQNRKGEAYAFCKNNNSPYCHNILTWTSSGLCCEFERWCQVPISEPV
jgi:hypothetical protein